MTKQAEILSDPINQDIETWFKENKGNEFWLDKTVNKNYGTLENIQIKDDSFEIDFLPIVNDLYGMTGNVVGFSYPKNGFNVNLFRLKTNQNIKLPYYIIQDHVNRVITIAQHGQKPKVTIEIDDYNDLEFATKIVNILNENL